MLYDVMSEIRIKLADEIDSLKNSMTIGACVDYPAYREHVGHIKAYAQIQDMLKDIEKKYLEE